MTIASEGGGRSKSLAVGEGRGEGEMVSEDSIEISAPRSEIFVIYVCIIDR